MPTTNPRTKSPDTLPSAAQAQVAKPQIAKATPTLPKGKAAQETLLRALLGKLSMHGWSDVLTGFGDSDRDMLERLTFDRSQRMKRPALDALYETGGVAASIVDLVADDAVRPAFIIDSDDDLSPVVHAMQRIPVSDGISSRRFGVKLAIGRALKLARLYGGAAVIVSARDGAELHEPLDEASLLSVDRLLVHHRHELLPLRYNLRGEVVTYQLNSETAHQGAMGDQAKSIGQGASGQGSKSKGKRREVVAMTGVEIHASRVFPVFGTELASHRAALRHGWGDSVLERVMRELRGNMFAEDHAVRTLGRKNVPVLKTDGLDDKLSTEPALIRAKAQIMMEQMSLLRLLMIDSRDEITSHDTNLGGFRDVMDALPFRLAAAARIPVTRLYGMSPSGFSTGEAELVAYENLVQGSAVELYVQPFYQWVAGLMMVAQEGPLDGMAPPNVWEVKCGPQREKKPEDLRAEVKDAAITTTSLVGAGLLTAKEARENLRPFFSLDDAAWTAEQDGKAQGISDEARVREASLAYPSGALHLSPDVANPLREMLGLPPWTEQDREDFLLYHGQPDAPQDGQDASAPAAARTPSPLRALPPASPANHAPEDVWRRTWTPTAEMAEEARQGLALRRAFKRGGTMIGVRRATQIANRQPMRLSTIRRMRSFFARHAKNKQAEGWGDNQSPSNGWIAHLLWGGDAGKDWCERIWRQTADEREVAKNAARHTPHIPQARGGTDPQAGLAFAHAAKVRGKLDTGKPRLHLHAEQGEGLAQGVAVVVRVPEPLASLIYRDDPARVPHVTLAYFPALAHVEREAFAEVVAEVAHDAAGFRLLLGKLDFMVSPDARTVFYQYAWEEGWAMGNLRDSIIEDAKLYGWQASFPDRFIPHVTLAYLDDPRGVFAGQVASGSWYAAELEVWAGDADPIIIPLGEMDDDDEGAQA